MEEGFSIDQRIGILFIKTNKQRRFFVMQANAPTATYQDEDVDSFYEEVG